MKRPLGLLLALLLVLPVSARAATIGCDVDLADPEGMPLTPLIMENLVGDGSMTLQVGDYEVTIQQSGTNTTATVSGGQTYSAGTRGFDKFFPVREGSIFVQCAFR